MIEPLSGGLKLKIPPPIVGLMSAALTWIIARATPTLTFTFPGRRIVAACIALAAIAIALAGVVMFRRAGTTVNPLHPENSSALVTSGVYRFTRNPMYLGMLLLLAGWSVLLSNVVSLIILPAFLLYLNRFQIAPEEAALTASFGDDFTRYRSRVRRWL